VGRQAPETTKNQKFKRHFLQCSVELQSKVSQKMAQKSFEQQLQESARISVHSKTSMAVCDKIPQISRIECFIITILSLFLA
jgi:hypothetical protein